MVAEVILFVIFISFSAFFSASETALFSLSSARLRRLQERNPRAGVIKKLLKKPTRLLSAIVFGNTLVNVAFSSLCTAVFVKRYGERGLFPAIFISGTIILFLGEIFPKTLAIYLAERFSLAAAFLLKAFSRAFSQPIIAVERLVKFFSRFPVQQTQKSTLGEEELKTAIFLSRKGGHISAEEEEMISYVLEFKDTAVRAILTARVEVDGIDTELSQEEVLKMLREKRRSKFPVYRDSLDNLTGILYAKDLFLNPAKNYRELLREPVFVPESRRIDDLLKLFLERNERIAIVLDEYGGMSGLVTLEDIEEEIFGEIYDEFEMPKELIEEISKMTFRIYGKTPIKALNIELNLNLPEEEDSVAGFLLSRLERIPRSGEKISFFANGEPAAGSGALEFTIERATAKRIITVILRKR